jgi:outer membrane protein assembly factor BamE (lipoprotein component of BamABCDE complex)
MRQSTLSALAMRPIKLSWRITLIALLGLTGGCLYRMEIQQGNVLNKDLVAQLEPGMTRSQVLFLLGTPQLPNGFDTDRWDYYFYIRPTNSKRAISERLTVWFKDDKVDRFDGDAAPKPKATPATTPSG